METPAGGRSSAYWREADTPASREYGLQREPRLIAELAGEPIYRYPNRNISRSPIGGGCPPPRISRGAFAKSIAGSKGSGRRVIGVAGEFSAEFSMAGFAGSCR